MPLHNGGVYIIREVTYKDPNPGVGGMYATGNHPKGPVIAAPQTPDFFEFQRWKVTHAGPGPEEYTLELVAITTNPGRRGFSWPGETPDRGEPVILDGDLKRFTLNLVKIPGTDDIYQIRPVVNHVGVDIFVGARRGGPPVLDFQYFPVGAPQEEKPVWKFIFTSPH
ncbi:peptidase inhibitor clitocypin-domain-containing protein [Infundibulicybe gibba]|nr:peptidase inhibitor clitocypin-domain-containing protein [Infundibulicybe gibba]